jgi:hypothetical protein
MIPSRELSIGEIINETLHIAMRTFTRGVGVAMVLGVISTIIIVAGIDRMLWGTYDILKKDYRVDSVSISEFREGIAQEIKEKNPTLLKIYLPELYQMQIKREIKISLPADSTHTLMASDSLAMQRDFSGEVREFLGTNSDKLIGILNMTFLGYLLSLFFGIFASTCITDLCIRNFEERRISLTRSLLLTIKRNVWLNIIQFLLLAFIVIFGLGLMFVVGSIMPVAIEVLLVLAGAVLSVYTVLRLVFAQPALISEELGPWEALHRSWQLTRGYFWRTVGILIVVGLMFLTISLILQGIANIFIKDDLTVLTDFITGKHNDIRSAIENISAFLSKYLIGSSIVSALLATLSPALMTTMYYDLRTRKEGSLEYPEDEMPASVS